MRQTFHILRSADDQAESFDTLARLARRIHEMRGDRDLHMTLTADLQGHRELTGPCVRVHLGEAREDMLGYVFFPQTRAWLGENGRTLLMDQLHQLRPDLRRGHEAEVFDLERERSGRDAEGGRSASHENRGAA